MGGFPRWHEPWKSSIQGRAYDVIEKIGAEEARHRRMRERAKSVGADVVLAVKFDHGEGGDVPLETSGTAIQFRTP